MIQRDLFVSEILNFLRTLTIKNQYFAAQIRLATMNTYGLATMDDQQNPYYRHLCGEYCLEYGDEMMQVKSLDVMNLTIDFTKANLILHPRTAAAYRVPGAKFDTLCSKYPNQVDLIKAIVYPITQYNISLVNITDEEIVQQMALKLNNIVMYKLATLNTERAALGLSSLTPSESDAYLAEQEALPSNLDASKLTAAEMLSLRKLKITGSEDIPGFTDTEMRKLILLSIISAPNYSLLCYDIYLLQENERESILATLRQTLAIYLDRWDVAEFSYEEYYPMLSWSILWYHLPVALLAQRISNLRTGAVHTTQIWEYLQSKGLGDYRTILDLEQQLFLYKNIDYIQKNKGKTSNLELLSKRLLKNFNVALSAKSVLQNTVGSKTTCILTPEIVSEDLYTKTTALQNAGQGTESVGNIVLREYTDGLEPQFSQALVDTQQEKLSRGKYTYLATKLVELNKNTMDLDFIHLMEQFFFQTMLVAIKDNRLTFQTTIQFPETEIVRTFEPGELIAFICYCLSKSENGVYFDTLANWQAAQPTLTNNVYDLEPTLAKHIFDLPYATLHIRDISALDTPVLLRDIGTITTTGNTNTLTFNESSYGKTFRIQNTDAYGYSYNSQTALWEHLDQNGVVGQPLDVIPNIASVYYPYRSQAELDAIMIPNPKYVYIFEPTIADKSFTLPYATLVIHEIDHTNTCILRDLSSIGTLSTVGTTTILTFTKDSFNKTFIVQNSSTCGTGVIEPPPYDLRIPEYITPLKVLYRGSTATTPEVWYNMDRLLDVNEIINGTWDAINDTRIDAIPMLPSAMSSPSDMVVAIDNQFKVMLKHRKWARGNSDLKFALAFDTIYPELLYSGYMDAEHEFKHIDFELVSNYTTYADWIREDEVLYALVQKYDGMNNPQATYATVAQLMIDALFPLNEVNDAALNGMSIGEYGLMKKLFMQLCSYNIAFLDTDRSDRVYLINEHITVDMCDSVASSARVIVKPGAFSSESISIVTTNIIAPVSDNCTMVGGNGFRSFEDVHHMVPEYVDITGQTTSTHRIMEPLREGSINSGLSDIIRPAFVLDDQQY